MAEKGIVGKSSVYVKMIMIKNVKYLFFDYGIFYTIFIEYKIFYSEVH